MPNPPLYTGLSEIHTQTPPHRLGAIKVDATSLSDTPTQSKKEDPTYSHQ